MTGEELTTVLKYAATCHVALRHRRTGYFAHIVTIRGRDYKTQKKALIRLTALLQQQQDLVV